MKKHKTILLPLGRQFSIILVLFIVCTAGITLYNTQDCVRVQTDFLSSSLDSYSSQLAKNTLEAYYSIHLVIIVYSYLLFCYTPFKKQFWRIRNATLSCYTY